MITCPTCKRIVEDDMEHCSFCGPTRKPTDTIWAVAVDEDCEPLSGMAHLMKYTDNPPDEVESRTPICGQTFRARWMQLPADGDSSRCVKCLKIEVAGRRAIEG